MDILFFLLLGHFCGDYALQSDNTADRKKSSVGALSIHVLSYTLCIWVFIVIYSLLYQPGLYLKAATLIFLTALFIEHWAQDYIKGRISNGTRQLHFIDQIIHVAVLYIYRIFIFPY